MGRVSTNKTSVSFAVETSPGVVDTGTRWKTLEPNEIPDSGAEITTVSRTPISQYRQEKKGTTVDLDSKYGIGGDLTWDAVNDLFPYFIGAKFFGGQVASPTSVTASSFVVPAMTTPLVENTLIRGRNFTNSENNGLLTVGAASTATNVVIAETLVAETPTATKNTTIEVAGFRFSAGDLEINADGNIVSTTKDLTELPLMRGMAIGVGGDIAASRFAVADNKGFARIVSIAANLIVLDKTGQTFAIDNGAGKTIELRFGRFLRNVSVNDADYLEESIQIETTFDNLGDAGETYFGYSEGNFFKNLSLAFPPQDKAGFTVDLVGTDTKPPSATRVTGAANKLDPAGTSAYNTTSDFARLRIQKTDETGISTDFKSMDIVIDNNVSPEKVLGRLGAKFMNLGNFTVKNSVELLMTSAGVAEAVRNNTTVTMDSVIQNDDGAVLFDFPSTTMGGGAPSFPVNESVTINSEVKSYGDAVLGTSLGVSMFPSVPEYGKY